MEALGILFINSAKKLSSFVPSEVQENNSSWWNQKIGINYN